jgi:hypothetical protein
VAEDGVEAAANERDGLAVGAEKRDALIREIGESASVEVESDDDTDAPGDCMGIMPSIAADIENSLAW